MHDVKLLDLIDANTLQNIQDAFANATGMAALAVDLDGPITQLSNPTEFCMNITRGCEKGAERCNQCDLKGGQEAAKTGHPAVYYCHGGLVDFAAPIFLGKKQIGSLLGGQVLTAPPDEEKFRRIAREIGVNEDDYVRAVRKIKIVPKESIDAAANLMYIIANTLSEIGYQKMTTQSLINDLLAASDSIRNKIVIAFESIQQCGKQNASLVENIDGLMQSIQQSLKEIDKTDGVVKVLNNISMQTKLLGFNASIEAARAGQHGAGFAIIAQEIRELTASSEKEFDNIESIVGVIKQDILAINNEMQKTSDNVQDTYQSLNTAKTIISEINNETDVLKSFGDKFGV